MNEVTPVPPEVPGGTEHLDVLIIGAGISGIGAAHHLSQKCPDKRFAMLESKASFGGTWRQHTYPGIRSDSDLYTFGYGFKPWTGQPIANGDAILNYLQEAIEDDHLEPHIRYQHEVVSASWSSDRQHWVVRARNTQSNEFVYLTCNFLWMCQGYYRHAEGYTPHWDGVEEFKGRIVHPQTWPEDLDYTQGSYLRRLRFGNGSSCGDLYRMRI